MLDSFYVHIRLLADFLVKPTHAKMDFGPADFGVEWTIPTTEEADRLAQYWQNASTYVVHFGRPRVPNNVMDLAAFEVGGRLFRAMAADALVVYAEFLKGLLRVTPAWSGGARGT